MGMAKYLIILTFILSFSLYYIGGYSTSFTDMVACFQNPGDPLTTAGACHISGVSLYLVLLGIMGALVGVSAIMIAAGRYPDPYTIFASAGVFLLAFITFPTGMLNSTGDSLPEPLKLLMGGLFGIAYLISFLEFQRGGTF